MSETHSGIDGFRVEAPKVYFPCHKMALQMPKHIQKLMTSSQE
jgi:hypothetical protein